MVLSIQDRIPNNHCFGCGPQNPAGLHIQSFPDGDETVCTFRASPHHMAGPTHVLNGGIIATIIDCHCICTAIAHAYTTAGREIGTAPLLWCVTAALKIDYVAPTPISEAIELRARIREASGRKRVVDCVLRAGGAVRARAEVIAVEVPAT